MKQHKLTGPLPSGHLYLYVCHDVEFNTNLPQFVLWTGHTSPFLTAECFHWFSVKPKLTDEYTQMLVVSQSYWKSHSRVSNVLCSTACAKVDLCKDSALSLFFKHRESLQWSVVGLKSRKVDQLHFLVFETKLFRRISSTGTVVKKETWGKLHVAHVEDFTPWRWLLFLVWLRGNTSVRVSVSSICIQIVALMKAQWFHCFGFSGLWVRQVRSVCVFVNP